MFFRLSTFLFIFFFTINAYVEAQNLPIEAYVKQYQNQPTDSLKLKHLIKVAAFYVHNNLDSAKKYVNEYVQLAEKTKIKSFVSKAYMLQGSLCQKSGDYKCKLNFEIKVLKLSEEARDTLQIGACYARLGRLYGTTKDYNNAKLYYAKALFFFERVKDSTYSMRLTMLKFALGQLYFDQNKLDTALTYLKLAESQYTIVATNDDEVRFSQIQHALAKLYAKLNDYDHSLLCYKKALKLFTKNNQTKEIGECEEGIAGVLILKNALSTASLSVVRAEQAAIKSGDRLNLLKTYKTYALLYDSLKNYKLKSVYLEKMSNLKDTLNAKSFNEDLANARTKFETINREKENTILTQKNKIQSEEIEAARLKLITFVLLVAFIIVFAYLIINKKRLGMVKKIKNVEQSNLGLQMNPHFTFNAINSAQSFILSNRSQEAYQFLASMGKLIRMTLEYSRDKNISIKEELDFLALYIALEEQRIGDKINLSVLNNQNIDLESVLIPAMLLQPLIENSIWHGLTHQHKKQIEISFKTRSKLLEIIIKDNGSGIKQKKFNPTSKGLSIVKERIRLQYAREPESNYFSIENEPATTNGTFVTIVLPILTEF